MGKSLTLDSLVQAVMALGKTALGTKLEAKLADYRVKLHQIKQHRNKRIAHNDLETKLNGRASPLAEISRKEIQHALSPLREFMDDIEMHFTGSTTAYRQIVLGGRDGDALIGVLRQGLRHTHEQIT
jgi:hypothetical protein